jgi:hypothetical protein
MANIVLYRDENFRTPAGSTEGAPGPIELTGDSTNLKTQQRFNDAISSVIVYSGTWTLYEDINFHGNSFTVCSAGGPDNDGRYPYPNSLAGRNDAISSVRLNSEQP